MTLFWLIASAMLLIALIIIIPAFFFHHRKKIVGRQKQNIAIAKQRLEEMMGELIRGEISREEYSDARAELEQSLHNDLKGLEEKKLVKSHRGRWIIPFISIALPGVAVYLYFLFGTPQAIDYAKSARTHPDQSVQSLPSVEEMAERLKTRLQSQPENIQGWLMLARTYQTLERYEEAIEILKPLYEKADNPDIGIHYANAIAIARQGRLEGKPTAIITEVLKKYPDHPMGLLLAGMAAAQNKDYQSALERWEKLQPLLGDEAEIKTHLQNLIAQAKQHLGVDDSTLDVAVGEKDNSSGSSVNVLVSLDPSLANQIKPTDTLFVYAQALAGPRMPLAVVRVSAEDLPVKTILSDRQAMMPKMKLSNFSEVRIGARISRSGNAIPQSGDFEGTIEPVKVGMEDLINVVIARRLP